MIRPTWASLGHDLQHAEEFVRSLPEQPTRAQMRVRAKVACRNRVASLRQVLLIKPPLVAELKDELDEELPLLVAAEPHRPRWARALGKNAIAYPPTAVLPADVERHYEQFFDERFVGLEFEQTSRYRVESQQSYWDDKHYENELEGHWRAMCLLAAHGDSRSLAYRRGAWEEIPGGWRLRPHIMEAGRRFRDPSYLVRNLEYLHESTVLEAIEAGRVTSAGSGTRRDPWLTTSVDLSAAIERYGIRIG